MFCTNCGNEIPDDAEFCNKCGTRKLDATSPIAQYSGTQNYANPSRQINTVQKPKKKRWPIVLSSLVGVVVLIVVIAAITDSGDNAPYYSGSYSDSYSDSSAYDYLWQNLGSSQQSSQKTTRLSGTYKDVLGLMEFTFRGDKVDVTYFGFYFGEASYKIADGLLTLYGLDLFGTGYKTDGESSIAFRQEGNSIYIDDYRLWKQ